MNFEAKISIDIQQTLHLREVCELDFDGLRTKLFVKTSYDILRRFNTSIKRT